MDTYKIAAELLDNKKALSNFGAFFGKIVGHEFKLSKGEKARIKSFYSEVKEKRATNHEQNVNALSEILKSLDYRLAKIRKERAKEKSAKKKAQKVVHEHYARKPIKIELEVDETHNSDYYKALRSGLEPRKDEIKDIINSRKGLRDIGLGVKSKLKKDRVKSDEVVIDDVTRNKGKPDKYILYTPGWSAEGCMTNDRGEYYSPVRE